MLTKKIEDIEQFENLKRKDQSTVKEFIADFEKCVSKLKVHKIEYPKDVQGYKLLKGSNIPSNEEKLIRASCTDIEYESVSKKLKSVYGDERPKESDFQIKAEPTFLADNPEFDEDGEHYDDYEETEDVMYTSTRPRRGVSRDFRQFNRSNNQQRSATRQFTTQNSSYSGNWRDKPDIQNQKRGKNPISKSGFQTRCRICQSINHWEKDCPDKDLVRETADATFLLNEVVLHANNDVVLKALLAETWSCALLDCGATITVCGSTWFNEFKNALSKNNIDIPIKESSTPFRFGDGVIKTANKKATIPVFIGNKQVKIITEIVDANIPLLLSIKAMKTGKLKIDFENDKLLAFDQEIPLQTCSNGLYALSLTKPRQLLSNFCHDESNTSIVLTLTDDKSSTDIAKKLHRCFAHPSADRLLRMLNAAGEKWAGNTELKNEIKRITEECDVCKIFKKAPARPTVGLPMSEKFNDIVAMDLKFYKDSIILHLVDLCTRLSAAAFVHNKQASIIIKALFQMWISVFGAPLKFMSDNGGEFANYEFLSLCERFNITVKTTPAESPWCNGIVERNNQTIARSMDKIIEDTQCSKEIALCWAVNAKNSLMNQAGFSPFQLVFGTNPRLPSCLTDEIPALTQVSTSNVIRENLNALQRPVPLSFPVRMMKRSREH